MERDPDIARCQKPGMVHECHMAPEVGSMFFFFVVLAKKSIGGGFKH